MHSTPTCNPNHIDHRGVAALQQVVTDEADFDAILDPARPELTALARALRALIVATHPAARETVWPTQRISSYGFGPKKMSEHHCYIAPQQAHVNLGFYRGADLPDPSGLLEGEGKALRHIKCRPGMDLAAPALLALIDAAVAERQSALGLS